MAFLSAVQWTPDPVPALPAETQITFTVTPGVFADEGIVIEYVLHSLRAQFTNVPAPPALADNERTGSTPTTPDLVPKQRSGVLIVDQIPDAKPKTKLAITRVVNLVEIVGSTPGIASITVTVSDLKAGGIPTDVKAKSALISL